MEIAGFQQLPNGISDQGKKKEKEAICAKSCFLIRANELANKPDGAKVWNVISVHCQAEMGGSCK